MVLDTFDWILITIFLIVTVFIGIKFASRAGQNLGEFFLGGRSFPWYIAGFSMVATTFAADTPLYVTEEVGANGIAGNWLWWNMLIGGTLTTFFFARLWRRAEILTDLEIIEVRYGGKPAAFLRGFKSVYLGLIMNAIIIAWVNVALMTILEVFFGIPANEVIWYIAAAMAFVAIYSSLSGLWGIAINDFIQFSIAITGSIVLAVMVISSEQIGGIEGLKSQLPEETLNFFPAIGTSDIASGLTIGLASFLAFVGVQWWASWYPGAEPGGGGYIAQRMMSARDEKHSLYATLFFQIAHYCIRSWPWILVGLAVIIIYPDLQPGEKRYGYVFAMRDFLPSGLRGLLLVTFLSAYMSTISTQLNWGTSYLINDFYKRFIVKHNNNNQDYNKHYVLAGRIGTILMMFFGLLITTQLDSIKQAWEFVLQGSAGMGLVLILRWYWWRINAWSELTATITPLIIFGFIKLTEWSMLMPLRVQYENEIPVATIEAFYAQYPFLIFPGSFFLTVGVASIIWLIVTFVTRPEKQHVLEEFYTRVKPGGWWAPVQKKLSLPSKQKEVGYLALAWISALILIYATLFAIGKLVLFEWQQALLFIIAAIGAFIPLKLSLNFIFKDEKDL